MWVSASGYLKGDFFFFFFSSFRNIARGRHRPAPQHVPRIATTFPDTRLSHPELRNLVLSVLGVMRRSVGAASGPCFALFLPVLYRPRHRESPPRRLALPQHRALPEFLPAPLDLLQRLCTKAGGRAVVGHLRTYPNPFAPVASMQ